MSQKKKAAPLPDSLRKELRRTIAIYIYSDVVCKKDSMKEIDQIKLMETLIFGSGGPDAISYIDMFLNGGGVFEFMFEQHKRATLTIVPFLQLVQHRIKRMMKTTIK